jgi:hypothetical protein
MISLFDSRDAKPELGRKMKIGMYCTVPFALSRIESTDSSKVTAISIKLSTKCNRHVCKSKIAPIHHPTPVSYFVPYPTTILYPLSTILYPPTIHYILYPVNPSAGQGEDRRARQPKITTTKITTTKITSNDKRVTTIPTDGRNRVIFIFIFVYIFSLFLSFLYSP